MNVHKQLLTLLSALLLYLHGTVAMASEKVSIKAHDQMLELDISDARLDEIVTALGDYLDFETLLIGDYAASKTITTRLKAVPIANAVERIVANANSLIVYSSADVNDTSRRITQVWLLQAKDDFTISGSAPAPRSSQTSNDSTAYEQDPELNSTDVRKRSHAMLRLARQMSNENKDTESFEWTLADLTGAVLYDPDPLVRSRAATALGRAHDPRAVAALQSSLSDAHFSVRSQAINALSNIGGADAVNVLGDVLTSSEFADTERAIAAQVLWKHESETARAYLARGARDSNPQIRELSSNRPITPPQRTGTNTARNTGESR